MHTLPRWSSPHFMNNGKPSFAPPPMTMQSGGSGSTAVMTTPRSPQSSTTSKKKKKPNIQSFIRQSEELFLIPNGLADVAVFGLALLILSLTQFFLQQ